MIIKILDTRHPGARHLWSSGQMPEYENPRDCSCQGSEEQTSLLQSKYDGGDNLGIGQLSLLSEKLKSHTTFLLAQQIL